MLRKIPAILLVFFNMLDVLQQCVGVQSRLRLQKVRYTERGLVCVDYMRSTHFTA
jgi:hypothetical protein